jgi:hypothetical protein
MRDERCDMHTKFWLEDLNRRNHLKDLGIDQVYEVGGTCSTHREVEK